MSAADQGVSESADRYQLIPRVLCFVIRGREVLLLKGAPDKALWAGKYNGVGGHVERDEDVRAAAVREIREETGLEAGEVLLRGIVNIDTGQATGVCLFVFTASAGNGELRPSREGSLAWVPFEAISALELVEDLPALLPRVLAMGPDKPPFFARYHYDENSRLVTEFD